MIIFWMTLSSLLLGIAQAKVDNSSTCHFCQQVVRTSGDELYKDRHVIEIAEKFLNKTCSKSAEKKITLGIDCKNVSQNVEEYAKAVLKGNDTALFVCEAIHACERDERPEISEQFFNYPAQNLRQVLLRESEKPCILCSKVVNDIIEVYIKNMSKDTFLQEMTHLCLSLAPFSLMTCTKITEKFGPNTFKFLSTYRNGTEACTRLNVCKKPKEFMDFDLELSQDLGTEEHPGSEKCNECFSVMSGFGKAKSSEYTYEQFQKMTKSFCHGLKKQRQHCSSLVSAYGKKFYKSLSTAAGARKACRMLSQCGRFESPSIESLTCKSCTEFVNANIEWIQTSTEEQLVQRAKHICWRLRLDDGETPHCMDFVEVYAPKLKQITSEKKNVQTLHLNFCGATTVCGKNPYY